jgi:hypothetical protein
VRVDGDGLFGVVLPKSHVTSRQQTPKPSAVHSAVQATHLAHVLHQLLRGQRLPLLVVAEEPQALRPVVGVVSTCNVRAIRLTNQTGQRRQRT